MVQSALNPYLMSDAAGTFGVTSDGYVQGMSMDQPAVRNMLAGGVLSASATVPMWGGCAITELVAPTGGFDLSMGGTIIQATVSPSIPQAIPAAGQITGFSVFDQNYAAINSPASPVPLVYSGGLVNFYRLGSGARIKVACDPSLVSLEGFIVTGPVGWNFTDQTLEAYEAASTNSVTSITWAATNGGQSAVVMAVALPQAPAIGDQMVFSGTTNTGNTVINGVPFYVTAVTDASHFIIAMPGTSSNYGTIAGTILLQRGAAYLPVSVLKIQLGNSMVVNYNPLTGTANWNRSGTVALIQL